MRADSFLTKEGYTASREKAKSLIMSGSVTVDGRVLRKPSEELDETCLHEVVLQNVSRYVSRGGDKLEKALRVFGISVSGKRCLDIGMSTGGFTDCLLQAGAGCVVGIDVGKGQLAASLARDSRVTGIEHYNARDLSLPDVGGIPFDLVVTDVSFISQTLILPRVPAVLADDGIYIGLVKPQFEAGRSAIGKGGIVKDFRDRLFAAERVYDCAAGLGLCPIGFAISPIRGGDGNTEYLICFGKAQKDSRITKEDLTRVVKKEA